MREFWRKVPGKFRENCWKNFPESRNAANSRISGTGKGKPAAGNLGSTLPGPCPHLPCGVFFEIDSSSLLSSFSDNCQRVVLTNACALTCRFICLFPPHPQPSPPPSHPSVIFKVSFSVGHFASTREFPGNLPLYSR